MSSPDCFGTIFPDMHRFAYNKINSGKVFSVKIKSRGLGVAERHIELNQSEWNACHSCSSFSSCYDFCMAKLNLMHTLRQWK